MRVQTVGVLMGILMAGTLAGAIGWRVGQAAAPHASTAPASSAAAATGVQAPQVITDYLQGIVDSAVSDHSFIAAPQTKLLTVEQNKTGTTVAIYEIRAQTDSGPADIILEVSAFQGKAAGSHELHRLSDPSAS